MFSAPRVYAAAILVPPGLDGDAVIAGIEVAIFDQHVRAGLRIAAICIGTRFAVQVGAGNGHLAHCDIRAQHRMDLPHR